ncbi:MAG: hypothetical protein OEZ29_07730, partial [Candidatus Bathyarchaeota archaeon]|nr:hypothetical protein [Candidatus Bathyarchaeota archaeon]
MLKLNLILMSIVCSGVEFMGLVDVLRREFSFIEGNYRILVVSWIIMDLAFEMPAPNYQYYVE